MVCKNGIKEYLYMALFCFVGWFLLRVGHNYLLEGGTDGIGTTVVTAFLFAVLFTAAMFVVNKIVESKSKTIRGRGANYGRIICEGSATINGNGGWLFLTENGFEFYPHKVNFNRQSIIIFHRDITHISKGSNNLTLTALGAKYKFVVCKANVWVDCINRTLALRTQ